MKSVNARCLSVLLATLLAVGLAACAGPAGPRSTADAKASAEVLLLDAGEVPGGGWQAGDPSQYEMTVNVVCGVDLTPLDNSSMRAYVQPNGLTLYQVVRPAGATQAREAVSALGKALPTCTIDQRTTSGGEVVKLEMVPVTLTSTDAVAYRQTYAGADMHVWAFAVYFTARDSLVGFTTFSTSPDAPTQFLDGLVAAVRQKG